MYYENIPFYGTVNKGYRFKIPEQGQPSSASFSHWEAHKAFCGALGGRCFWRGVRLPLQEMETFTEQRRDPGEQVAHLHCFTCQATKHQCWRQCWFIHEAQQAEKVVAPARVSDLQ